jgi:hypothetical protein
MPIERQWATYHQDGRVALAVDYDRAYEPNQQNPNRVYVRRVLVTNTQPVSAGMRFIVRQGDRFWDRVVQPQAEGQPPIEVPIINDLPGGKGYLLQFDSQVEDWVGLDTVPIPVS